VSAEPLTTEQASAVFDLLVRHAGASESLRDEFLYHLTNGCWEFRFQGWLGSGGKLYVEPSRWRMSCYPEDETPDRLRMIETTNAEIDWVRRVSQ